jgi:hypothetical protein
MNIAAGSDTRQSQNETAHEQNTNTTTRNQKHPSSSTAAQIKDEDNRATQ